MSSFLFVVAYLVVGLCVSLWVALSTAANARTDAARLLLTGIVVGVVFLWPLMLLFEIMFRIIN